MTYRLRVNPIACTAHGMCAELLPELIELDPWGYPILLSPTVPASVMDHARRAVRRLPDDGAAAGGRHRPAAAQLMPVRPTS